MGGDVGKAALAGGLALTGLGAANIGPLAGVFGSGAGAAGGGGLLGGLLPESFTAAAPGFGAVLPGATAAATPEAGALLSAFPAGATEFGVTLPGIAPGAAPAFGQGVSMAALQGTPAAASMIAGAEPAGGLLSKDAAELMLRGSGRLLGNRQQQPQPVAPAAPIPQGPPPESFARMTAQQSPFPFRPTRSFFGA